MILKSDSQLIDIDQHFRIFAGPGAGKTYWLSEHIKNILYRSDRLGKSRKIACITYTNIGVETILARLGTSAEQVEVSTIHSFLYKHIVKPYASFIAEEFGLKVMEMDGHDDIIVSNYSFLQEWKARTGQLRINNNEEILHAIKKARWRIETDILKFKPDYPMKANGYAIKNDSYFEYKKMTWEKGILHHDDVLFFSYQLIKKFPFVLEVLRLKFPYFMIDEFQDSNPIQVAILNQIGQSETIVGIIGDKAQSIFGFQGTDPSQFSTFSLNNMNDYTIEENRRSTNEIINVLNHIRKDITQISYNSRDGVRPMIIVGNRGDTLVKSRELCGTGLLHSLSRDNITSNAMKRDVNMNIPETDLFSLFYKTDSNPKRRSLIIASIKATELAREKKFKDAIKELEWIFKDKSDKEVGKRQSLKYISILLEMYEEFKDKSLFDFHIFVKREINSEISRVTAGAIKAFYDKYTYQELAICVKIVEDTSNHKTIHKSKGDEFDNVLLVLKEEKDLEFLLNSDLEENEEHRINYVAVSRAKNRLFISVPTLKESNKEKMNSIFDFEIL